MTNKEILQTAMRQSAVDLNCVADDFLQYTPKIVFSAPHPEARKYLTLPFSCNLVSYGNNVVASVNEQTADIARAYLEKYPAEHCFETPNLHVLNDALQAINYRICYMAEYFLPDIDRLRPLPCDFSIKLLTQADFIELYTPQWNNALCERRKNLDVLAAAAYDGKTLIGMAGCSADCETMWQIGVDVLPQFRQLGIASALTSRLAVEILDRDKVPFCCAAWSNIKSVRNAIRSRFLPTWVEMTAKDADFVKDANR